MNTETRYETGHRGESRPVNDHSADPLVPAPLELGKTPGWAEATVQAWLESRPRASRRSS